jgi:quinolinate synthase
MMAAGDQAMNSTDELARSVRDLKQAKRALILAHNYQTADVQAVADYLGDSLDLSRRAAAARTPLIVFAGVKFMAETAKVLAPDRRVLLPRLDAGCPMADMITVEELRALKAQHPDAAVVTYVNSAVEIKAESDVCCTSANAVQVVRGVAARKVIFVPDQNLGRWVQRQVPEKELILFEAYCYVHNRIKVEEIVETKQAHPQARVLVHPEARPDLLELADEVLSTSGMLRVAASSPQREFIVATEQGLLERMARENPGKSFYPARTPKICQNMKRTSLGDVLASLAEEKYEIFIDDELRSRAFHALNEMLQYG